MLISLHHPRARRIADTGGKGAALAELLQAGFPVPDGFVVPAALYAEWISGVPGLAAQLAILPHDDPAGLERAAEALKEHLRTVPVPEGLLPAVRDSLAAFSAGAVFAVRSSSTTEDMAGAAFAGQHDSFLNCAGPEDITERIRDCWLSLWSARALDYRRRTGFSLEGSAMAVVVQELVAAETAGVAFSLDPVTGESAHLVVSANYGLGESVVGGEMAVDHYVLERSDGSLAQSHVADKAWQILPGGHGSGPVAVPEEKRRIPCLSETLLAELAGMLFAVERHYAHPVDIEWAWREGRFLLLQARPVTRIPARWTRDESAERFPNAVTPLSWEFAGKGFHRSLNHSLQLMGLQPYHGEWFAMFDNYIYGNQNAVEIYAERMPFSFASLEVLLEILPSLRERFAWVRELPLLWPANCDSYLLDLGRIDGAIGRASGNMEELWALLMELQEAGTAYFLPNIAISVTQRTLHRLLQSLLEQTCGREEASLFVNNVLASCETKTMIVNRELIRFAQAVAAFPGIAERLRETPGKPFLEQGGFAEAPELEERFQRFLRDHGHREVEYDPYIPPWAEAPWHVIEHLRALLLQTPEKAAARNSPDVTIPAAVPETLHPLVSELIRLLREYTCLDDLEHYQTTRLYLPFRRILRAMGALLQAKGILRESDDIYFSSMEALQACIFDSSAAARTALRDLVLGQKAAYGRNRLRNPAWRLGEDVAKDAPTDANILAGIPGSPGQAEGPVYIVRGPEDFAGFPQGAVLVARTTSPAWTPLFYKAAAVIAESGGPLSHGAVTAREMGLPAVMAVPGAMERLAPGQMVTIDGTEGTVRPASGSA